MNLYIKYIVFLLICILSRVISAIYYIEDPESLRYALCVFDQANLSTLPSHFPGSPLFCFVAKILYFLLRNFSVVFSILGGISVFVIIISLLKLLKVPLLSLEGALVAIFVFFNPLIWLTSNKYMPDLAGLAVVLAAFSYLVPDSYKQRDQYKGWILTGLLAGIHLPYLPFLIIPCVYALKIQRKYIHSLTFLFLGILFWLVPLLFQLGWDNFLQTAQSQILGNFYNSGGTVFAEYDFGQRASILFQRIWADGLGGYWADRNPVLWLTSIGTIACGFFGFLIILSFDYSKTKIAIVIGSWLFYAFWIYLFQDINYKTSLVLPLLPFILILLSYGIIYFLVNYNFMYVKVLVLAYLLGSVFISIILVVQHTEPTAIAKVREYIITNKQIDEDITIVSVPIINEFLSAQKVKANFVSVHPDSLKSFNKTIAAINTEKIIVIGNLNDLIKKKPFNVVRFHHNPYINRIWPDIMIYEYYSAKKLQNLDAEYE